MGHLPQIRRFGGGRVGVARERSAVQVCRCKRPPRREELFVLQKHLRAGISCPDWHVNYRRKPSRRNAGTGRGCLFLFFSRKQTTNRGAVPGRYHVGAKHRFAHAQKSSSGKGCSSETTPSAPASHLPQILRTRPERSRGTRPERS